MKIKTNRTRFYLKLTEEGVAPYHRIIICYINIPWEQKWDEVKRMATTTAWKRRLIIDLYFVALCFNWEFKLEEKK
jgi:hypothetical protein